MTERTLLAGTHMKIAVIETGYADVVSGADFAEWGSHVVCADKNARSDPKERARQRKRRRAVKATTARHASITMRER